MGSADEVHVLQFTDLHLYADKDAKRRGIKPYRALEQILEQARQDFPQASAVLLTGDISQDDTKGSYVNLVDAMNEHFPSTNVYFCPGNHDQKVELLTEHLQERQAAEGEEGDLQRIQGVGTEEGVGCFELSDKWSLVLLNSMRENDIRGEISEATAKQLERTLADIEQEPTGRHVLLALHHPPFPPKGDIPPWTGWCLEERDRLLDVIKRHPSVQVVLTGHTHSEFTVEWEGRYFHGAPATCHQYCKDEVRPGAPDPAPVMFVKQDTDSYPGYRYLSLLVSSEPTSASQLHTTSVHRVPIELDLDEDEVDGPESSQS